MPQVTEPGEEAVMTKRSEEHDSKPVSVDVQPAHMEQAKVSEFNLAFTATQGLLLRPSPVPAPTETELPAYTERHHSALRTLQHQSTCILADSSVVTGIPAPTVVPQVTSEPFLQTTDAPAEPIQPSKFPRRTLQSSKVPSSRIGRLFHYGGAYAWCALGTLGVVC